MRPNFAMIIKPSTPHQTKLRTRMAALSLYPSQGIICSTTIDIKTAGADASSIYPLCPLHNSHSLAARADTSLVVALSWLHFSVAKLRIKRGKQCDVPPFVRLHFALVSSLKLSLSFRALTDARAIRSEICFPSLISYSH